MCEEIQHEEGTLTQAQRETMARVEECPNGAGDYRECTLRNLSLFFCYELWLVVEDGYNKVRSLPVFVSPIDYGECLRLLLHYYVFCPFSYYVLPSDSRVLHVLIMRGKAIVTNNFMFCSETVTSFRPRSGHFTQQNTRCKLEASLPSGV